jgi:hypothetical protein
MNQKQLNLNNFCLFQLKLVTKQLGRRIDYKFIISLSKKKWRIQNGDYNITFRVSVKLGLMSLKNCNRVR